VVELMLTSALHIGYRDTRLHLFPVLKLMIVSWHLFHLFNEKKKKKENGQEKAVSATTFSLEEVL